MLCIKEGGDHRGGKEASLVRDESRLTFFVETIVWDPVVKDTLQNLTTHTPTQGYSRFCSYRQTIEPLPSMSGYYGKAFKESVDFGPGSTSAYLLGEVEGGVGATCQQFFKLLEGGGDQRDRLHPLTVLQLPQATDELRLRGINQTWRTEEEEEEG